jgi:hypothetical protein
MSRPGIAYPEMQKSSLVLYDMAAFYLPLYGRAWEDFFTFYPVLALVEGLIYQVEISLEMGEVIQWEEQKNRIMSFLHEHRLVDSDVEYYLVGIGNYFESVRYLMNQDVFSHEDIVNTAELRPSDIRLLHTLLTKLMGQPLDGELFVLLWPLENLLDLKANVTEYADDVATGHYNSYQMFVKRYGNEAPCYLKTEQSRYQDMFDKRYKIASGENRARLQCFMREHERAYPSVPIPDPVI